MTDLVERLRACNCGIHCKSGCIQLRTARREIERLRHEEMRLRTALDYHVNELRTARREIDRLRGAA